MESKTASGTIEAPTGELGLSPSGDEAVGGHLDGGHTAASTLVLLHIMSTAYSRRPCFTRQVSVEYQE